MIENPLKELRILKGAPLSIIFALMIVKQSVNARWLGMVTGYSDKTITEALNLLTEFDYIKKISGQKWQISTNKQLPLMIENDYPEQEEETKVDQELFAELTEIGIGEPARSELARMDKNYIHAHVVEAKIKKIKPGLFIHRIRSGDPKPKLNQTGHLEGCTCFECDYLRFKD